MRAVISICFFAYCTSAQKLPVQQLPQSYSQLPVRSRSFLPSLRYSGSQLQYPATKPHPLEITAGIPGTAARRPLSSVGPLRAASGKTSGAPMVTLYKIQDGRCSESTIEDGLGAVLSKSLRGFKDGDCKSQGYTKADGSKTTTMPIIGELEVKYFLEKPPSPPSPFQGLIDAISGGKAELPQASSSASSAIIAGSIGFAIGSGILLAVVRLRRETVAVGYEPLSA